MIHTIAPEGLLRFMFSGRARFALKSKHTEKRYVYEISTSFGRSSVAVQRLEHLTVVGHIEFGRWRRVLHWDSAVAFERSLPYLLAGTYEQHMEVQHLGRCGRCGRELTRESSIGSGLGPICAKLLDA